MLIFHIKLPNSNKKIISEECCNNSKFEDKCVFRNSYIETCHLDNKILKFFELNYEKNL